MPGIFGALRRPQTTVTLAIAVGLYLLVVVAEPFLHHSDACHASTPWHCTACSMQMTSPGIEDDTHLHAVVILPDAGQPWPAMVLPDGTPVVQRPQDRSPPPAAAV